MPLAGARLSFEGIPTCVGFVLFSDLAEQPGQGDQGLLTNGAIEYIGEANLECSEVVRVKGIAVAAKARDKRKNREAKKEEELSV